MQGDATGRLSGLDGLRGVAILLVIMFHVVLEYPFRAGPDALYYKLGGLGWIGVDLFFVLSGFLITGILLDNKGSGNYLLAFFGRRALRIFPLYYAVLIFLFVILPPFGVYDTPELQFVQSYQGFIWTFMTNWGFVAARDAHVFNVDWLALVHFWSLAVEEQFYLVWPFLVLFLSRKRFIQACLLLLVGALGFRLMIAVLELPQGAAYTLTPARIDSLALGALIAAAKRHSAYAERFLHIAAPWCAAVAAIIMVIVFMTRNGIWFADRIMNTIGFSILAIGWGGVLVMSLPEHPRPLFRRILSSPTVRLFGVYSYGLYILHHLILPQLPARPFAELPLPEPVAATLYLLVCTAIFVAAAWLSWNLLEKRFLALKWMFEYKPAKPVTGTRSTSIAVPVGQEVPAKNQPAE
ncbi:MAG: acyltransferase [Shinella sp.]|nr:acyltransferase [Shinella sp.]